jgi:hypothetical protein
MKNVGFDGRAGFQSRFVLPTLRSMDAARDRGDGPDP